MASKFLEVDPNLVWEKRKKADVKPGEYSLKPWSNLQELPEFSYKSAYKHSHPYQYEYPKYVEPPPPIVIPQTDDVRNHQVLKNHYVTTYGKAYEKKIIITEPGEKPTFLEYLDSLRIRLQKKLFFMPEISTEYSTNYKQRTFNPLLRGVIKDQKNEIFCKAPEMAKKMQPFSDPSEGGVRKERDIYQSETHYTHYYFTQKQIQAAKEPLGMPESGIRVYADPNPLDPGMGRHRQITLRPKVLTVPHRGMITEFQESYQPQVDFFELYDNEEDLSLPPIKPAEKEDMIKNMDRNHTEYSHIGTNWSTQNI